MIGMSGRGLLVLFTVATAWSAPREIVVAADGGGRFRTVQAALDAVPRDNRERVVVAIRNGTYREQLTVRSPFVTLRGEDRKRTRIEWEVDTNAGPGPGSKEGRYTSVLVEASDVTFENLTVENPYKGRGKGAALSVIGDATRVAVKDADIVGYGGDTLALISRGLYYLRNVYVSGTYHIIVPRGSAYFTDCTFWCMGHRTCLFNEGISRESERMVIRNSKIDGPEPFGLGSYFRDAAWYFIDNTFSDKLRADGQIFRQPAAKYEMRWGERVYFLGSKGVNHPWLRDNVKLERGEVTPGWALSGWEPE
jgi:pectinesterase